MGDRSRETNTENKTHSVPVKLRDGSTMSGAGETDNSKNQTKKHNFGCTDNPPVEDEKPNFELLGANGRHKHLPGGGDQGFKVTTLPFQER